MCEIVEFSSPPTIWNVGVLKLLDAPLKSIWGESKGGWQVDWDPLSEYFLSGELLAFANEILDRDFAPEFAAKFLTFPRC